MLPAIPIRKIKNNEVVVKHVGKLQVDQAREMFRAQKAHDAIDFAVMGTWGYFYPRPTKWLRKIVNSYYVFQCITYKGINNI